MNKPILMLAPAFAVAAFAVSPAIADSSTFRIETEPHRGAVVTIEAGVRVFRGMPPVERVVVNPGGQTPLALELKQTTVNENRSSYNYHDHRHRYIRRYTWDD
ncbi:hypothetical protein HPQ64_10365 [Rhizobiales bacterium]|uniref:hypothetical protein n=1 Tax=Hongsoonwoonella zoysiae TaxID=2821844 RepID=UPI0015601BD4|nr:hypothetical protein [Hongsoonwoonella zoysiae]NRG18093.1 hypothetical protein [Hongsoonwoonella zoysiae]